jgi:hypothetical protein
MGGVAVSVFADDTRLSVDVPRYNEIERAFLFVPVTEGGGCGLGDGDGFPFVFWVFILVIDSVRCLELTKLVVFAGSTLNEREKDCGGNEMRRDAPPTREGMEDLYADTGVLDGFMVVLALTALMFRACEGRSGSAIDGDWSQDAFAVSISD